MTAIEVLSQSLFAILSHRISGALSLSGLRSQTRATSAATEDWALAVAQTLALNATQHRSE